jgi:hypothetical protein
LQANQLLCERSYPIDVTTVPPKVHSQVAAIGPTQVDAPYAVGVLRPRQHWPCRGSPEPRNEFPPPHELVLAMFVGDESGPRQVREIIAWYPHTCRA